MFTDKFGLFEIFRNFWFIGRIRIITNAELILKRLWMCTFFYIEKTSKDRV